MYGQVTQKAQFASGNARYASIYLYTNFFQSAELIWTLEPIRPNNGVSSLADAASFRTCPSVWAAYDDGTTILWNPEVE